MYKRIAVSSAVPFRAPLLGHILFFRLLELVHIIRTAMTILGSIARQPTEVRLVGSDRVLAVLVELAKFPDGVSIDEMARPVTSPKPTVHRALASLRKAGLAGKDGRGRYALGDEFLRKAFVNHELRSDHVRVQPILARLAARYGETAHFAVLDGHDIVNRAKSERAFQLERNGQWSKGKSCEIFNPPFIVYYLSQFLVLEPGDLINTGTPPGVGMGPKPPVWLHEGDVMELGIEGPGNQRQNVAAPR
jgi:DNA-binding transcriptional ArsR family regulator